MKTEITEALKKAEMDEAMVVGQAADTVTMDYDDALTLAAFRAIQRSERTDHPVDQHKARLACAAWIEANEADAMQIINKRIRARAARAERDARPLTAAEIDKQLGM